jgi:hypothetical protein
MPRAATFIYPGEIDCTVAEKCPTSYERILLAEGDSWFSFGSVRLDNLLQQLRFEQNTMIVTLAEPGDTIIRMSAIRKNPHLEQQFSNRFGYAHHAILLSGGGNDVIDRAAEIIPPATRKKSANKPAADYCDLNALRRTLNQVAAGYAEIVALRDRKGVSLCVRKPIIIHTYDYITPRDAPAKFLFFQKGPWLYNAMLAAKIPPQRWNDVADFIIDALAEKLLTLPEILPNVHVVDTRGRMKRAAAASTGVSNDSVNEIHATRGGYQKAARPINALLTRLLA